MSITTLPFAKRNTNGTVDAWAPEPSGNYSADCALGNNYFEAARFHAETNPLAFSHIMQAMVLRGQVTGVEVGFLHSMSTSMCSTIDEGVTLNAA